MPENPHARCQIIHKTPKRALVAALCDAREKRERERKESRRDGEERGAAFRLVVDALFYSFSYVVGKNLLFPIIGGKSHSGPVPFVWYKTSLNGANRVVVVVVPFFFRPKRDALRVERVGTLVFPSSRFSPKLTTCLLNSYLKLYVTRNNNEKIKRRVESLDSKKARCRR